MCTFNSWKSRDERDVNENCQKLIVESLLASVIAFTCLPEICCCHLLENTRRCLTLIHNFDFVLYFLFRVHSVTFVRLVFSVTLSLWLNIIFYYTKKHCYTCPQSRFSLLLLLLLLYLYVQVQFALIWFNYNLMSVYRQAIISRMLPCVGEGASCNKRARGADCLPLCDAGGGGDDDGLQQVH